MRSTATPIDHIDMKKRTKATAFATKPICAHISIKSREPLSIVRSLLFRSRWGLTPTACAFAGFAAWLWLFRLPQSEIDGHRHDDRHRHAVQQRRRVLPLPDSLNGRRVEQWDRTQHAHILHAAVRADCRFENHDALHTRRLRDGRIRRRLISNFLWRLNCAADANRRRWGRRRRRGFRDAAGNTTDNDADISRY